MIFLLVAIVALLIALLRGVPLASLAQRQFVGLWALGLAAGLHVALNPVVLPGDAARALAAPLLPGLPVGSVLYLASLSCALVFLMLNRSLPGLPVILMGLALNFVVIAANGGQMPGDPQQLERAGLLGITLARAAGGLWSPFTIIDEATRLPFLADIIFVPIPFREPTVVSVGDVVIALGLIVFFNPVEAPPRPVAAGLERLLRRAPR